VRVTTSLKSRLILAATLLVLLGVTTAGTVLSVLMREHIISQFRDELVVHLEELQRLSRVGPDGVSRLSSRLSDPRYDVPGSGYYWQIGGGKHVPTRSPSLGDSKLAVPPDDAPDGHIHTHVIDGPTGRLLLAEQTYRQPENEKPLRYIIGTDQRHIDNVIGRFDRMLAISLGLFAFWMIGTAGLLVVLALRPLDQLRLALADVRAGARGRLEGRFPDEVRPLVDDLNAMLGTAAELMQRARAQAGKLAHALKTPLAIISDEARRLSEHNDSSGHALLDQCHRMQCQIDYQIARARSVSRPPPGTISRASDVATAVVTALQRLYQERALRIHSEVPNNLVLACDKEDLNEILGNLVDNACKHARSEVLITRAAGAPPGFVRLSVEDDGKGLPGEAYNVVLELGERWTSTADGSGLGLTIVRDIARLYGGDVALGKSRLGGLQAMVDIPSPRVVS
jgi:signal transduction histidine kinase